MEKKVSIIIPVYNSSKYLKKCLDSVIKQTYKNIEIICIENGSQDNSLEILKSYKSHIKLIKLKEKGLSKARNKGIEASTGHYIYFLDSDDYIDKNIIKELVKNIEEKNSDLAYPKYYSVIENTIKETESFIFDELSGKELLNNLHNLNYGPQKLFRSSIIKEHDIKFPIDIKYEDVDFVLHYISKINKITFVNKYLYYYVVHDNSETTVIDEKVFDILKILKIIEGYFEKEILENFVVLTCTRYSLRQRYQKDRKLRNKFINEAYKYLDERYPNWKNSEYLKNDTFLKSIIKKSKLLLKIYTFLYSLFLIK